MKRQVFSMLVLFAALGFGALAGEKGVEPPYAPADAKSGVLNLVPNCKVLVTLDVRALDTDKLFEPLWGKLLGRQEVQLQMQQFAEAFGFDLRRDLNQIVFAADPSAQHSEFILLDGRLNTARIQEFLVNANALQDVNGDHVIYALPDEKQQGKSNYLTFLKPTLIAFGQKDAVKASIERLRNQKNTEPCAAAQLLQDLPEKSALRVAIVDLASMPGDKDPIRNVVRCAAASLELGEQMKVTAIARCKDDAAAKSVAEMAQGALAFLRVAAAKEPQLEPLLKNAFADAKAVQQGALAQLTASTATADAVKALVKFVEIQEKNTAAGTIPPAPPVEIGVGGF